MAYNVTLLKKAIKRGDARMMAKAAEDKKVSSTNGGISKNQAIDSRIRQSGS